MCVAFDIVGQDKIASVERGIGARHFQECQRTARTGAYCHVAVRAGFLDKVGDIGFEVGLDVHGLDGGAHLAQRLGIGDLLERHLFHFAGMTAAQDLGLFSDGWVADCQLEHETVKLGFGQGEGAFVLDRVLGCHHQKGSGRGIVSPSSVT
jgi:hypothetical protein